MNFSRIKKNSADENREGKMKEKKILLVFMVLTIIFTTGCSKTSSKISEYLNTGKNIDTYAKDVMPEIKELPEHESMVFKYTHKSMFIFESDSFALILKYNDEIFYNEREKLEDTYRFLKEGKGEILPEHEFNINSYNFKVVADEEESHTEYPKYFGMIGVSEKEKSIAYLYFYDSDLDCVHIEDEKDQDENPMRGFVESYFDYEFK